MDPLYHLFYNPNNQAQLPVPRSNSQAIENLKKEGWLADVPLVAMYNPEYDKHTQVRRGDEQKRFEQNGYFSEPTMIYHTTDGTKMVGKEQAAKMVGNNSGWRYTPAEFTGNSQGKLKTLNISKEAA